MHDMVWDGMVWYGMYGMYACDFMKTYIHICMCVLVYVRSYACISVFMCMYLCAEQSYQEALRLLKEYEANSSTAREGRLERRVGDLEVQNVSPLVIFFFVCLFFRVGG